MGKTQGVKLKGKILSYKDGSFLDFLPWIERVLFWHLTGGRAI
jgi:hypothetical protein